MTKLFVVVLIAIAIVLALSTLGPEESYGFMSVPPTPTDEAGDFVFGGGKFGINFPLFFEK